MNWWGWIIAGAILLGAELAFVDAQFYLVLIGSASVVTGLATLALPGLAPWLEWALFSALALVLLGFFRARIYGLLRGRAPEVATGPIGGTLTMPDALDPGATCRVEYRGTFWTARNDAEAPIPAGGQARVTRVHGLTLSVRPDA